MLNIRLLVRPHSYDRPKVEGYEPQIKNQITRISRSRRNAWRLEILVGGNAMYMSHHDTKYAAESKAEDMMKAYAEAHYYQV